MNNLTQVNLQTCLNFLDKEYTKFGTLLDKDPTLYKNILIACHLFRASTMFSIMQNLSLPFPVAFGVMLAPSLLYRASIERFCIFRFTLPSLAGGSALWMSRAAVISLLAGTAFSSLGAILKMTLGVFSLAAYLGFIYKTSNADIENYMQNINKKQCCQN